jgi:hypothetical protein
MNRIHRRIIRPLLFALAAAVMVATLGEPVTRGGPAARAAGAELGAAAALPTAGEGQSARQAQRGEHAARLRWLMTLPHARNSCCRRPVRTS